jgi:hypothetical protein
MGRGPAACVSCVPLSLSDSRVHGKIEVWINFSIRVRC